MKKLLSILLLSGLLATVIPANARWGSFAAGSMLGWGMGSLTTAIATSGDRCYHHCHTVVIDDRDELKDQNALLREKVAALRAEMRDLERQNKELEEENAVLRHKIKKMEHMGSKLMIKVDANAD